MNRLILAGLAAGVLCAVAPVPAHATTYDFRGECDFETLQQATVTGDQWIGTVGVLIVATDDSPRKLPAPDVRITDVSCELLVNGMSQGTVLTAPDGTGVTGAVAAPFGFTADLTDEVVLCTNATVGGTPFHRCPDPRVIQIPPGEYPSVIEILLEVLDPVLAQIDPVGCAVLRTLAALDDVAPDVLHVDPETGDTYLLGELFWDCPPYETEGLR
jgi:hypothetical protein